MKRNIFKKIFWLSWLGLLLMPQLSGAVGTGPIDLNLEYPSFGGLDINEDQNLNEIIAWFYYFVIGIVGIATLAMFIKGGFLMMTAGGNADQVKNAREQLSSAVIGLIVILSSYLILKTINPELTILRLPSL